VAHSGLRSERIRIPRGERAFSKRRGEEFVICIYCSAQKPKIVDTRRYLGSKCTQNAISAEASPETIGGTGEDLGRRPPRKLEVEGTEVLVSPPIFRKFHYKFTHVLYIVWWRSKANIPLAGLQ